MPPDSKSSATSWSSWESISPDTGEAHRHCFHLPPNTCHHATQPTPYQCHKNSWDPNVLPPLAVHKIDDTTSPWGGTVSSRGNPMVRTTLRWSFPPRGHHLSGRLWCCIWIGGIQWWSGFHLAWKQRPKDETTGRMEMFFLVNQKIQTRQQQNLSLLICSALPSCWFFLAFHSLSAVFATKTLVTNYALAWPSYQPHRCKRRFLHRPVTVQSFCLRQPLPRFKTKLPHRYSHGYSARLAACSPSALPKFLICRGFFFRLTSPPVVCPSTLAATFGFRFPTSNLPKNSFPKIRWVPKTLSSVKVTEFPNDKSTWVWAAKCMTVSISCIGGLWCEIGRCGQEEHSDEKWPNMSRYETLCQSVNLSCSINPDAPMPFSKRKKHAEKSSDKFFEAHGDGP